MRKSIKIMIATGLILSQFLFSTDFTKGVNNKEEKQVEAAAVALPSKPTVRNEVAAGNSISVSTGAQLVSAYTNTTIRNIVLMNDIILFPSETTQINNHALSRSLKIDGGGFKLGVPVDTFNIGTLNAVGTTFHLANIVIEKRNTTDDGFLVEGSGLSTDIIFENVSGSSTSFTWESIISTNPTNLFIRGTVEKLPYKTSFSNGVGVLVFENNSIYKDDKIGNSDVFIANGTAGKAYFGENSKTHVLAGNDATVFRNFSEVNVYTGADVWFQAYSARPTNVVLAGIALTRVDSGAKFKVQNESGIAYYDDRVKSELYFNPGSVVEFIGRHGMLGAVHFENTASKLVIDEPKYFDIINVNTRKPSFTTENTGTRQLQIRNTYIGLWGTDTNNVNTEPMLPTPFIDPGTGNSKKVTLIAGGYGEDPSSSPEFNGMPGGYSSEKYNRIATSVKPIFNAENLTMLVTDPPTPIEKELITPEYVTWTYTGYNTSIISVNSNGVVTPKKAGITNVTITAKTRENYTSTKTITVTVIGVPTMTVDPTTVSLPLNSVITNYYEGVSAVDGIGNPLLVTKTGSANTAVSGIYPVKYSATDALNNTVTGGRDYIIGNNVTVGNYAIFANDFTKRISEVDTSDEAIRLASDVKVFDLTTGTQVPNNTLTYTIDKTGYTAVVGEYPISFTTTVGTTELTIEIVSAVIAGNNPVISGATYKEVALNGTFDEMGGVTATDTEDGTITGIVNVTGEVDTTQAGVYTLTYSVTDSDDNTTTVTRVVLVQDNNYFAGTSFIIRASDFTKRVGQVVTTDAAVRTAAGVVVYSKTTGAVVDETVTVNKGEYSATVGEYPISFTVTSDLTTTKSVVGTVITGGIPVITSPSYTELEVDAEFDEMAGVSATDVEDGNITNNVRVTGSVNTAVAGVYPLTYSVTDSDLNTVTKTRVVVVNDGNYVTGDSFIIHATDFTKRIGEVDMSDAAIKTAAEVVVYSKTTGLPTTEAVTVDNGGYTNVIGEYDIIFTVNNEDTLNKEVVGTVITGEIPVLTVLEFEEIELDAEFDIMDGVSATDVEDGDLTDEITHAGEVDTSAAGVYVLDYEVTDSDGNTVEATKTVLVNDGNYVAGDSFIIHATDFTKRVSEVDTSNPAVMTAAEVVVYNKTTGAEIVEPLTIDKGGYSDVVGTYTITFSVTSDLTTTISIVGTVSGGNVPTLTVPAFSEINVDEEFDEMDGVSATDIEDGNITEDVIQTGEVDITQAGVYVLDYEVTDEDNNTVVARQIVVVNDGSYFTGDDFIIRASDFTKRVGQVIVSDEALIESSSATVYDRATGLVVNEPLTIDQGGYSDEVGIYQVTFSVTDDLTTTIEIDAEVITGNLPILSGVDFINIEINTTFDSMDGVSAIDVEDGNITNDVVVTGSVNTSVAGVYPIVYSITDSDRNTVTAIRSVIVNDGSIVIDGIYAIAAHDFEVREDLVDTSDEAVITAADVKVYDLTDGTEIVDPTITVDSTGYTNEIGTYPITFSFNPSITITATVVENLSPDLITPFAQIKPGSTHNPLTNVTAIDAEDGDLIDDVTYGELPDTNVVDIHTLDYSVTDTFDNTTDSTRIILVNDGTFTVNGSYIFKANNFSINQSEVIDTSDELVRLSGLEIYDTVTGEKVESGYIVDDGGYSSAPGKYTITFTMGDGSISIIGTVVGDGIKLPETGSENGLIYLLLISTLAFSLFKRRA